MRLKLVEAAKLVAVSGLLGLIYLVGTAATLLIIGVMAWVFIKLSEVIYASPHNYLVYSVIPALGISFIVGIISFLGQVGPDIVDLIRSGRDNIRSRLRS